MTTTRLITALGPSQLLNAIAVLRFQADTGEYSQCNDYLVLGGIGTLNRDGATQRILDVCQQIAAIWPFKAIVSTQPIEHAFHAAEIDFFTAQAQLKTLLGLDSVDVVYAVRNWQVFNEICLTAYASARKICYGDGYGVLDVNDTSILSGSANPSGLIQMDDAYLVSPGIERVEGTFEQFSARFIDFSYFEQITKDASSQLTALRDYCHTLQHDSSVLPTLVLPSNGTEAGLVNDIKTEMSLYLSSILPYSQPNEVFLIKGHPRQTQNQAQILAQRLTQEYGFQAIALSEFSQIPIELFIPHLRLGRVFSLLSSSCVSLAYSYQNLEMIVGLGKRSIQRYIRPQFRPRFYAYDLLLRRLVQQAYQHQFEPTSYSALQALEAVVDAGDISALAYPFRISHQPLDRSAAESTQHFSHPQAEVILLTLALHQAEADLEQAQHTLSQIQTDAEQFKAQIQGSQTTQSALEQQLTQLRTEHLATQDRLQQTQAELAASQLELRRAEKAIARQQIRIETLETRNAGLRQRLDNSRTKIQELSNRIFEMEASQFWKLRNYWLKVQRTIKR